MDEGCEKCKLYKKEIGRLKREIKKLLNSFYKAIEKMPKTRKKRSDAR